MNPRNALAFALACTFVPATVPAAKLCQESKIRPTTPTEQFIIDADKGTVLDTKTVLMWKRCVEGRSGVDCMTGNEQYLAWGEALRQAADSTHAGYKDWRVPSVKELKSLVEAACFQASINEDVFPETPADWTWSSTPSPSSTAGALPAWFVSFYYGRSEFIDDDFGGHNGKLVVRLVRDGQ